MEIAAVIERVERLVGVEADPCADLAVLESGLVTVRELSAWLEARRLGLIARIREGSMFPEGAIADAERTSPSQASKPLERSKAAKAMPKLADHLDDGKVTAGHIDAATRASKKLPVEQREEFFDRVDGLADQAASDTVNEFARRVEEEARRMQHDDGMDRLERQKRAVRLRKWTDADGMVNWRAHFDPVTGVKLDAQLQAAIEALFAEATPEFCPDDPVEKQQFLAAHALIGLLSGSGPVRRSGRPEFVVVIDADAPGSTGPVAEFSIPVEIPARVLADLAGDADTCAVIVRNGVVLHAPGELNLGRTSRVANRAQRRALRGLYGTCGMPGCATHFDRCELHHIIWWRNGGKTDVENLIPLCSRCHHRVHDDGWTISLDANRRLTVTLPDGTTRRTGPPTIRAA
jgi:hypothetical protein